MRTRVLLAIACLWIASPPVTADEIRYPPAQAGVGLCAPFECGTRIQQVFDAKLFSRAITIESLTFFNTTNQVEGNWVEPTRYRFFLSTTPFTSNTITGLFDANPGLDNRLLVDWTVDGFETGFTDGKLTLPFMNTFSFDPRLGNLLLDIRKDSTAGFGDGPVFVDGTAEGADGVALLIDNIEPTVRRGQGMTVGLAGQFFGHPFEPDGPGGSPVPEPASLALIGSGLVAASLRRRRRCSGPPK